MRILIALLLFVPAAYLIQRPQLTLIEIDPSVTVPYGRPWNVLVKQWYPDAVIISAHGFDYYGEWYMRAPDGSALLMHTVLTTIRAEHPDKRIVVISCNPGGYVLDMPNVTYADTSIWILPDAWIGPAEAIAREINYMNLVGGMNEFIHNP